LSQLGQEVVDQTTLARVPDPHFDRVQLPSWFVPEEYDMTLHPNADPTSTFRFEVS
jgi:hypothetical protein